MQGELAWGRGGRLKGLEHVLVLVRSDTGVIGVAEAPARPTIYGETPESIEAIIRGYLAPALQGLALDDAAGIAAALASVANNHAAKGALDMALYEALLLSQGSSIGQLWRRAGAAVPASYILGIAELEAMLEEAQRVYDRGVRVFKVKIGRDAEHDRRVIRALKQRFAGLGVTLYADANESFSAKEAPRRLAELRELGVAYVEEPLPVTELKARAALKAQAILPIIADDACFSPAELARELDFDTFDILNIKPARTGVRQSLAMAEQARAAGKGLMLGSQASSGLGTLYTAALAARLAAEFPSEVSFPLKLVADSLKVPLSYRAGYLEPTVPDGPLRALLANRWGEL